MKRRARATSNEDSSATRPYWRGHLHLALVSCPIRLIPAPKASLAKTAQRKRA